MRRSPHPGDTAQQPWFGKPHVRELHTVSPPKPRPTLAALCLASLGTEHAQAFDHSPCVVKPASTLDDWWMLGEIKLKVLFRPMPWHLMVPPWYVATTTQKAIVMVFIWLVVRDRRFLYRAWRLEGVFSRRASRGKLGFVNDHLDRPARRGFWPRPWERPGRLCPPRVSSIESRMAHL